MICRDTTEPLPGVRRRGGHLQRLLRGRFSSAAAVEREPRGSDLPPEGQRRAAQQGRTASFAQLENNFGVQFQIVTQQLPNLVYDMKPD